MSESDCQKQVVQWFRLQYPDKLIIAIPNGAWLSGDARRRAILMNKMKREGLLPGVSDLQIIHANKTFFSLFIELKDIGKTWCSVTKNQKWFLREVVKIGYAGVFAFGFEHAKKLIIDYMENKLTMQNELL